jgi:SurA N-terminal domain
VLLAEVVWSAQALQRLRTQQKACEDALRWAPTSPEGAREKVSGVRMRGVLAALVVGAVVSGCAGPEQAGSAVIVGDTSVSLEAVQSQLSAALKRVPAESQQQDTPAAVARDVVTNEILHGLVERQATTARISVPDAAVDEFIAGRGGLQALLQNSILDEAGLRQQVRDNLLAAGLARRAVGGLQVTADLVAATSRAQAEEFAQKLAAGGAEATALFGNPQTSQRGVVYTAATTPGVAGTVVFGTPAGSTVYFQPNPQQATWIVFRVTNRRTNAPSDPAAVSQISQDELVSIGQRTLQPVAEQLGVRVNPRYGVWDPVALRVVPADQVTGGVVAAPAG